MDTWSIEDGLPQGSVTDIVQTRDGYLWLATYGGLVRFDGVRFTVFDRSVDGVESIRTRALHEARDGTLWAGTDDGALLRYRDGTFTTLTAADGLPDGGALRIDEAADGAIWVHSPDAVTRYAGERFEVFLPGDLPRDVRPRPGVFPYPNRPLVWWAVDADGLHCLLDGEVRTCLARDELPDVEVAGVTTGGSGVIYVHTREGGILRVAGGRRQWLTTRDGLPTDNGRATAFEDRGGTLWHMVFSGSLYRVAAGAHEELPIFNPLVVYQDREDSIWIGSVRGLHRVRHRIVRHLSVADGLSSDNVYPVLRTRRGDVWIGTWDGGLNRLSNGRLRTYRGDDGLPSARLSALYEDRAGTLWAGTTAGVVVLEDDRFRAVDAPGGFLSGTVWAIHEGPAGDYWFATDYGLVRRLGTTFTRYTIADGLPHDAVASLATTRDGALWVGTRGGVARFDGASFTTYGEREGFVGNQVRAFHEDAHGVLWVGTYDGGLYRFQGGRLTRYTTQTGLHDNGVFQILEDDDGHFWMGSNRGISRVSRRELEDFAAGRARSIRAVAFGTRDGLLSLECNGGRQPSGAKMDDGTLWFPTQAGVAIVNPRAVRFNSRPPPVVIEDVRFQDEPVAFRAGVEAAPRQNSFEIQYTALSFVRPEQVRFRYRLVGLDDEWVDAGTRRTASYHRVPPGRYTFEVMAENGEGVWSTAGDRVSIVVLAPVWRRGWFLALCGAAVVALLAWADRRRTARQRRERDRQRAFARQLLETQEIERRRISNDLHDALGQSLCLIQATARARDAQESDPLDAIDAMAGKAHADLQAIAYNLRPYQLDRLGVSRTVQGMLTRVNGSTGIRFDADIASIDRDVPADAAINVYRIVQEGVNNVIRHSGATEARVSMRSEDGIVEVAVADNGRGMPADAARSNGGDGGFGLMGIRERARSLNGSLTVRSSPGGGTTLVVRFPAAGSRNG